MNRKGNFQENHGDRREQERAMRLMEALSAVDEALLERCSKKGKVTLYRRPLWQSTRRVAAVMCLAVVGVLSWGGYQLLNLRMGSADSSGGNAAEAIMDAENGAEWDMVTGDMAPEEGAAKEELGQAEGDGEAKELDSVRNQTGQAGEGAEPGQKTQDQGNETSDTQGTEGAVPEAKDELTGNQSVLGETEQAGVKDDKANVESCPQLQSVKLTEEQSRSQAELGVYVPTVIPKGYVFEEAYTMKEQEQANLAVCWSRGLDYIQLHLEKPENPPATVDVARTESYDVRLYEIPYGETVPEKYRQTFDNPVFAAGDLTLEMVESRMKSYDDSGDTDTPRGNFGVYYPNGVLVRFHGRGTAEEIWEMFCSMGEKE